MILGNGRLELERWLPGSGGPPRWSGGPRLVPCLRGVWAHGGCLPLPGRRGGTSPNKEGEEKEAERRKSEEEAEGAKCCRKRAAVIQQSPVSYGCDTERSASFRGMGQQRPYGRTERGWKKAVPIVRKKQYSGENKWADPRIV
ncbi:UNVERIFIED_CONTAM: hypothetical protein FKN15_031336 [Acipenser sinensis]